MDLHRRTLRRDYWRAKYEDPQWGPDIHFALFPREIINRDGFLGGLRINTTQTRQDLQELASLYRLAKGVRVLDYGCGSGDLLRELVRTIPNLSGVGVDVSETAISNARARSHGLCDSLKFCVGELDLLSTLEGPFDIIICRDMYYTLDLEEQSTLMRRCGELLSRGGVLYIADLAIEVGSLDRFKVPLLERQYAGDPITWRINHRGEQEWSVTDQARNFGFELFEKQIEPLAVAHSYAAARDLPEISPTTKEAFETLSRLSGQLVNSHPCVPYVRLFFSKPSPYNLDGEPIGLRVDREIILGGKTILRQGEWLLPLDGWSLVLGRSGVGKTTLLNLLSGFVEFPGVERIGKKTTRFLLDQNPILIEELSIDENIYLFARTTGDAERVMESLGFDRSIRIRKADSKLSGGEWQRVALGQAIAARPQVLFLDEPGTGIDRVRKYQFFSTIKENLTKEQNDESSAVICVDHEFLQIESFFTYIFEMLHGRLILLKP